MHANALHLYNRIYNHTVAEGASARGPIQLPIITASAVIKQPKLPAVRHSLLC
jgi:hypothetical protein